MVGPTVGAAVRRLTERFAALGLDSPRLDAELLVADAIGTDRARLFLSPDRPLSAEQDARIAAHEEGRAVRRASVAHLLGVRGFRMLDLQVDGRVLVPRPETELLVEFGLELPRGATVVDVGTGSGAIALALADERPDLVLHATDVSADALIVARENARRTGARIAFHQADLLDGLPRLADAAGPAGLAVLSNPPYVPDGDLPTLPPEVRDHDPHLALFGGPDGLDVVRRLLPAARAFGAVMVGLEIGRGQAEATAALTREAGFAETEIRDDLAGIGRVVVGRVPEPAIAPLTAADVLDLTAATTRGGVVLFPAEGVYGLATDPHDPAAIARMVALKGRDPAKPSALMLWSVQAALAAVGDAGEEVRRAVRRLLPGPVGVLVPAGSGPFAAVCGPDGTLGVRVPRLRETVDAPPVLQTSANLAGGPDARTVADVPASVVGGCDLVLDRGSRPGTSSTIVDLRGLAGTDPVWRIVREGALPSTAVATALAGLGRRLD